MLALDVEKLYAVEAKDRQGQRNDLKPVEDIPVNSPECEQPKHQRESREKAAKVVGVGSQAVQRAKKIEAIAPQRDIMSLPPSSPYPA